MLTFAEVCDQLRLDPKTLRKIIKSGDLKAVRLGERGDYRISEEALADYLDRQAVRPETASA